MRVDWKLYNIVENGIDRLVNAATGTGKTLAYLAPVVHHLRNYDPKIDRSDGTFGMCFTFFSLSFLLFCFNIFAHTYLL